MEDRPNESDFEITKEYTVKTFEKFIDDDSGLVNFEKPTIPEAVLNQMGSMVKKIINPPTRKGEECSICRLCETLCPTAAMDADNGEVDRNKCIRCLRCVANCPDNVLKIEDLSKHFKFISKAEKLTEEILKNLKSKIFL